MLSYTDLRRRGTIVGCGPVGGGVWAGVEGPW